MRGIHVLVLAASVAVVACGGRQRCLGMSSPRLGDAGYDEDYGFLRREAKRSREDPSPLVRARILETLPALIPDASDRVDEPTCAPELVERADDVLGDRPVAYTRELVAQVRAVGTVGDTTDVMTAKAAFLMAVARLPDGELTDYRLGPDEPGPPPPKSYVRYLALGYLGHSNVYMNVPAAQAFISERLRTTRDARELLLLRWQARDVLDAGWVASARARLAETDPVALEAVLVQLAAIGRRARRSGVESDARALLQDIVGARGAFAVTGGRPGSELDLLRAAAAALQQLDADQVADPFRPARRIGPEFDPWRDWLAREPAGGIVPRAAVDRRLAALDGELAHLKGAGARCDAIARIAAWTPAADGERRFAALTATIFAGDALRSSRETHCRLAAALGLDGVAPEHAAALVARVLATDRALPYDGSADLEGGAHVLPTDPDTLHGIAARAAAMHPAWAAQPELRAQLVAYARRPLGGDSRSDELLEAIGPALEAVRDADLAAAWIANIREVTARPDVTAIWPIEASTARLVVLAGAAARLGITDQVRALCDALIAMPLPGPSARYTHPVVVQAATMARAML